jgi:hypothetical protein
VSPVGGGEPSEHQRPLERGGDLVTFPGRGELHDAGQLGGQLVGPCRGSCSQEVLGDRSELQERPRGGRAGPDGSGWWAAGAAGVVIEIETSPGTTSGWGSRPAARRGRTIRCSSAATSTLWPTSSAGTE